MKINTIKPLEESCSVCGKVSSLWRRYNGEGYCANCYAKWFPKKECSRCHQPKRIYLSSTVCWDCQKQTDCVRCGKASGTFKIGKITRYGAVCNVCSRYFRKERECFECGQLSRTMLRAPESGHNELLCLPCFRKYRFVTCKSCRRYRQVHDRDNQLCRKCSEQRTSQCPKCKQDMPTGYGNVCENCAKRTLLFNLMRMNVHLFRHKTVKRAYKKFIFWYLAKCGVSVVLKKSDDHVLFFMRCDENWADIPDYRELVAFFKPNGLRAHLTVLRWLLDTNQVKVDESLKAEMAELERIQSLFNKLSNSVPCIANYYTQLQHKYEVGKTSLKSVRLALQPAIDFISSESVSLLPNQEQLNNYLVAKTGQIAAITGFINHLNREYRCELEIDRALIQKMKEKQLKQQAKQRLATLYKQEKLSAKEQNELLSVVLLNLHNIWIKSPKKLSISEIDGIAYYVDNEKKYFIPKDIHIRLME